MPLADTLERDSISEFDKAKSDGEINQRKLKIQRPAKAKQPQESHCSWLYISIYVYIACYSNNYISKDWNSKWMINIDIK